MKTRPNRLLLGPLLLLPAALQAADAGSEEAALAAGPETPAAAAEAPAKPPSNPTCIEGRGFDFKTADGLFDVAIGANLQVRFSDLDVDNAGTSTEFRVRRFKLYFTGSVFDPRLTYRFQLAFENPNNLRLLDDAYL